MFTPLFTDGVWNTSFKTDLKDYCDNTRNTNNRVASNVGGYQSTDLDLSDPQLQPLISHIEKETLNFSRLFHMTYDSFKISNMWININGFKDYNRNHHHPGCLFSGVYYIHTPKDCGNIEFVRSTDKLMAYDWVIPVTEWNSYNCFNWYLPAEQHRCYIFPSFYEHRVLPNLNKEEERYSISFNLSSSF
jgi:uncharacterized protein (TIGR02466 family)